MEAGIMFVTVAVMVGVGATDVVPVALAQLQALV